MTLTLPLGLRLILAGGRLGWFWILVGIAAVVLLLVLYREERHLVSKRVGLMLLGLRIIAASFLVIGLFEPIAARTVRETLRGRVILGVDISESMATTDPGREGLERSKLLKILNLRADAPLDTMSRREIARGLMAGEASPLRKMAAEHEVTSFGFARETSAGTLDAISETLKSAGGKSADPSCRSTEWLGTLSEGLKTSDAPVLGIVLVTDGRRNGLADASGVIDRLGSRGVPVYSVLVGTAKPPRDAAIVAMKAPETVYQGDVATVEAVVKLDGYEGTEVSVRLERPGAEPMVQKVRAEAGVRPTLTFRVPLETVGSVPLSVAVGPLEGDTRLDNDRRTATVQVADDKAKVLLVDGEARWEFQYLRNALVRDARVALQTVVFQQPRLSTAPGAESQTYLVKLPEVISETTDDPLSGFDVIMLGDVDPSDLSAESWERLDRFVSARGGTLIFNPGPKHWAGLASNQAARKLFPVLDPVPPPVDPGLVDPSHPALPPGRSFDPDPVAAADFGSWPMLQLAAEADESLKRWKALPRLPWSIGGRAKPGATVLATSGDDASAVVLASQPYGLGKVLWVGTDATWRWRYRLGDAYHHRFWGQVVRWGASGKLGAGNALVRFGPIKPQAQEETAVRIQARIAETVAGLTPDTLLAARVFKTGTKEAVAVVPLRPLPGQPRTFEAMAPGLPVGSYKIRLDAPGLALNLDEAGTDVPEAPLEVSPREGSETIELAADPDALNRLAQATGGKVFHDFEADQLPDVLKAQTRLSEKTYETTLWDTPAALALFVIVLTVEWVARKRVGLP